MQLSFIGDYLGNICNGFSQMSAEIGADILKHICICHHTTPELLFCNAKENRNSLNDLFALTYVKSN